MPLIFILLSFPFFMFLILTSFFLISSSPTIITKGMPKEFAKFSCLFKSLLFKSNCDLMLFLLKMVAMFIEYFIIFLSACHICLHHLMNLSLVLLCKSQIWVLCNNQGPWPVSNSPGILV